MQGDLPFVHTVPSFPVAKKPASFVSFESKGEVSDSQFPLICLFFMMPKWKDSMCFCPLWRPQLQCKLAIQQQDWHAGATEAHTQIFASLPRKAHVRPSQQEAKEI